MEINNEKKIDVTITHTKMKTKIQNCKTLKVIPMVLEFECKTTAVLYSKRRTNVSRHL